MAKNKYAISDEVWEKVRIWIPARENTHPRGGGRKPRDDRQIFDAILFVFRFGCQWDVLNAAGLCPSSTVHDRFRKWLAAGVFHRLRDEGLLDCEGFRGIDWSWLSGEEDKSSPVPAAADGPKRGAVKRPYYARRERNLRIQYTEHMLGSRR